MFARQVQQSPDATALTSADGQLSYAELDRRATRLARRLRALGVAREERVAVCVERSPALVIALLGVLKAGGAYLPLDPALPPDRVAFMLQDGGVRVLVTVAAHAAIGTGLAHVVQLDDEAEQDASGPGEGDDPPDQAPGGQAHGEQLAYVCYTSGSTGTPKGVEVQHAGVVRLVREVSYVRLDATRTVLHAAPAAFDATTFELWGALLNGATVALYPPVVPTAAGLRAFIAQFGVTTAFLTTALVNAVVDEDPHTFAGLSQLLFGGEAVSVRHIASLQTACPELELVHVYGPTEVTTFATSYAIRERIDPEQPTIPIGRPIEQTTAHVLDAQRAPVAPGQLGELYLGGSGVARGYLGKPELSAERFVDDPSGAPGARLYRTGDLVVQLPSGDLVFRGRTDHQVKIRGHRIELGEIEVRLAALPMVREAVVLCREDRAGDKRLVAYVVPMAGRQATPRALRDALADELPGYMVPKFYVVLTKFPLSANGKIDRKQLPPPDARAVPREAEHVAPYGEVQTKLAALWEALLGVQPIGARDSFFELGGHSLLATRLLARVRESFGVELTLSALFKTPTIEATAPLIEAVLYLHGEGADQYADNGLES